MNNCRAARALRHSVENGDSVDMQAAKLAIELGMIVSLRVYKRNAFNFFLLLLYDNFI